MESNRELAIRLFEQIRSDFSHLRMELDPKPDNVDVTMDIPKQTGLAFKMNLNLQEDELHLNAGDLFWVEWFPCTDSKKAAAYLDAVNGLLSGRHRIVENYVFGKPATASLQRQKNGKWISIARWGIFWTMLIPWKRTTQVIRNVDISRPAQ